MSTGDSARHDLGTEFATTASILGSGTTIEATYQLIVDAAFEAVPTAHIAGIFLVEGDNIVTVASSDPLVGRIDSLQVELDEGPCLDAVRGDTAYVVSNDLVNDPSYPVFGPQAAELGIRAALGLRLLGTQRLGAINFYSDQPEAFDVLTRARAVVLAANCSIALNSAQSRERDAVAAEADLQAALASRGLIGQAQGILMERERITAEQAFDVLRQASQDLNLKLRTVAQQLVDTGEDPRPQRNDPT